MPEVTEEEADEAMAIDQVIDEDRSEEEQARRVEAVAHLVAMENHEAPNEEEVEALYTATPLPEASEAPALPTEDTLVVDDVEVDPGAE